MDMFLSTLHMLEDIISKKKAQLDQIYNITDNQHTLLLSREQDKNEMIAQMFNEMSYEKQELIDLVIETDTMFQRLFDQFKPEFEAKALHYKDQVVVLQGQIKEVMEMDVKIRALEEKNKMLASSANTQNKNATKQHVSKKRVLEAYAKNTTKKNNE